MRALLALHGGLFWTKGEIGAFSVSSLGLTQVGVYVGCACVYKHTHTHSAHMGSSVVSPGVGMRHLELGPEESRWTKSRHTCTHIYVQSTHVYVYARRQDEILD